MVGAPRARFAMLRSRRARFAMLRSRRAGRACVRPLNLIVRRPLNMPRRSSCHLSLALAFLLDGCATLHLSTSAHRSQVTLATLKQCLADVPSASGNGFVSPCAKLNVAGLSGLSIAELKDSLGTPGISSDDYVFVPNDPSAPPPPYECRWAFYRLSDAVLGGGPELQCVSTDRVTCKEVRWVLTQ